MRTDSQNETRRWLALWLPRLQTDRLQRGGRAKTFSPYPDRPPHPAPSPQGGRGDFAPYKEHHPLAIYDKVGNAFVLTGADATASRAGLKAGMALADARAMRPDLVAVEAEPARDAALLDAIAAWCARYTPVVALDPPDGLFLDITGCAHLFGDEDALRRDLLLRITAQGFAARAAIAPSPAAAWALAHFSRDFIGDAESIATLLAPLAVDSLRLEPESGALLKRLGLKTVGQLIAAPRTPLAARAGARALLRLDYALGRAQEPLSPRRPSPAAFAMKRFVAPLITLDAILIGVEAACGDLAARLDSRGLGARRLALSLYGVDARARTVALKLTRPERDARAMLRLFREKLSIAPEGLDAEFGIEMLRLDAFETAPLTMAPRALTAPSGRDEEAIARLIDALSARLGDARVRRIALCDAHAPEDAAGETPAMATAEEHRCAAIPGDGAMRRPLTLFAPPELVEAIASVPDGPPVRFRWRRVLRTVVRAEGPERIAMNWLTRPGAPTRDYYRVEDANGRRYWLYRDGLYSERDAPHWYVHGVFA
ncbi:MAG: DNA polymerase Y family protein [Alphaproteobacteria bacterium]|nr:DNA polymerase Y family protein [Alphaproteobacteria bacterium]